MSFAARIKTWAGGDTLTASDLNAEFNIAINALSDGTKDANVSALNCASIGVSGLSTLSGNVSIGNANASGRITSETLTINGVSNIGTVAANTCTINGNVAATANVVITNNLTAPNVLLNMNVAANVNVGSILTVTGNVNAGSNLNLTGDCNVTGNTITSGESITTGNCNVTGNLNLTGNALLNGNTTIGDAADDAITVTANTATVSIGFANEVAKKRARANSATAAAGEIAISDSNSGSFTSTSATNTNVTGLIVNITSSGRPIWVGLISDGGAVAHIGVSAATPFVNANASFILRETTTANNFTFTDISLTESSDATETGLSVRVPPSSLYGIHFVGAGTYTYVCQVAVPDGADTAAVVNAKLVAYEL